MTRSPHVGVIVPLDTPDAASARSLVETLGAAQDHYKVGLQLFTAAGPEFVRALVDAGKRVFLDLKFHDIPHTVHGAVRSARGLGVSMLTVHASGGRDMMRAAADAAQEELTVLGVTVLTSLGADALAQNWGRTAVDPPEEVLRLAREALLAGLGGMVTSSQEVALVRSELGRGIVLVTPGIRPTGSEIGDQMRVATPGQAALAGSDYLVIGRPITESPDPLVALERIRTEIREAGAAVGTP